MERTRVAFSDRERPDRSGALVLGDDGRMSLVASPALAKGLRSAATDPDADLAPLRFDDRGRGTALAKALAKGVPASLLECEFVAGAFELIAYIGGERVRLTLKPGDFDPDAAWEFLLAANDARLAAPRA